MKHSPHRFTTNFLFNICVGCLCAFFFQLLSFRSGLVFSFFHFLSFSIGFKGSGDGVLSVGIIWIVCSFNLLYTESYSLATRMIYF
ncbi:hypothetical protein DFP73DRAFT_90659 [Morchella snyderi]|nr:hypothetical protein DFP73DRAFT_90659 [Morchella snyderi]